MTLLSTGEVYLKPHYFSSAVPACRSLVAPDSDWMASAQFNLNALTYTSSDTKRMTGVKQNRFPSF